MGILSGNPKKGPMHYGEIISVWQFSMKAKSCISAYRAFKYHAGDDDLKEIIDDLIDQAELEASECDELLVNNGIVRSQRFQSARKQNWKIFHRC